MHARATEKPRQVYRHEEYGAETSPVTDMCHSSGQGIKPLTAPSSYLPSRAQVNLLMIFCPAISQILLVFSFFCTAATSEATEKSLYDKSTAQKLDLSKLSFFGPRASRFKYDKRLLRAAEIAADRARAHSRRLCWRAVKDAMLTAGIVDTRPKTAYAKEAATELTEDYGFKQIRCKDPYKAPIGSVLVYGGKGAGHIEFRTAKGFVSDFVSKRPSRRPLIGVFVK